MPYRNAHAVTRCRLALVVILSTLMLLTGITTANPSFSPDQGKMPVTVKFTFPGGDQCDSVLWDFGDGETSTEVSPTHIYKTMGFYYPQMVCTLPGMKIIYNFNKFVSSNADMPDPNSDDQHFPIETIPDISSATLPIDEQIKQADVLNALGEFSYAADAFKKVIGISASDPAILGKYGDVLAGLSRWSDAAAIYNQSLTIKEDPAVLNAYGTALLKLNKFEEALNVFNRTIAIDAGNSIAYTGIGKAFEFLKKDEEASAAYSKTVSLDDKQPFAWMGYGNVLNNLGKYSEAETAYKKAIDLGVSGAEVYNKYGTVLRKLDRDKEAGKAFSKARNLQGQLYSSSDDYIPQCTAGGVM